MSKQELEDFLEEENQYSIQKFYERYHKLQRLEELEKQIKEKKIQSDSEKKVIHERQNKSSSDILKGKK